MSRVVVALSGGVDSSVAAARLIADGHDVVAMTLQLYDCDETRSERSCCGLSGISYARDAAGDLGIPHYVVNGMDLFEKQVLTDAWAAYDAGDTPNPCVRCNEWMKFGLLYEQAKDLGADFVATGHHARIEHADGMFDDNSDANKSLPTMYRGKDTGKDQSYFLFSLSRAQLAISLFPIGDMTKDEVRAEAGRLGLANATRLESQDACIAQKGDFAEALRTRFSARAKPGAFKDTQGTVLGEHSGIHQFTVGQRKGLGLSFKEPHFVIKIDPRSRDVIVGPRSALAVPSMRVRDCNMLVDDLPENVELQFRYRQTPCRATLVREEESDQNSYRVDFDEAQLGVSPGQAAVFYDGDRVLGGGWIARA